MLGKGGGCNLGRKGLLTGRENMMEVNCGKEAAMKGKARVAKGRKGSKGKGTYDWEVMSEESNAVKREVWGRGKRRWEGT